MYFAKLLSRLPFPVLYSISSFLFFVSYYVARYRRKMVRKNLRNSFPQKKEAELDSIERNFYRNLCDYAVETLKLLTISKEELVNRMKYLNPDLLNNYTRSGQSVIILSSHQFNWEWLLVSGGLSIEAPLDFVYQSVNNSFFDSLMLYARSRFGAYPVKRNDVARELIKRKTLVRGIAIVADQYPGHGRDKKHSTTFLNQDTVFFYGSQQMASMTQYPVIYTVVKKVKRGYYTCKFSVVAEPPYEKDNDRVVESYARIVEGVIQSNPDGWLWSHNRWKKRHLKNAS
jgi:Kdo2-lipid IVA lauroyltransferase/acyltransferase